MATATESKTGQLATRDQQAGAISKLQELLPRAVDADRWGSVALAMFRDKALADCTTESKLLALADCAKLGLFPDRNLGHVWLVPFNNSKPCRSCNKKGCSNCQGGWIRQREVTLIPGYQGYIELARRSGKVVDVLTEIVYANDVWEPPAMVNGRVEWRHLPAVIDVGAERAGRWCLEPLPAKGEARYVFKTWDEIGKLTPWSYNQPVHTFPTDLATGRGEPIAVWCLAPLKGGDPAYTKPEVMSVADWVKSWSRSKARWQGPWVTDHLMMVRKSDVRRARKYWPQSPELTMLGAIDDALDARTVDAARPSPAVGRLPQAEGPIRIEHLTGQASPPADDAGEPGGSLPHPEPVAESQQGAEEAEAPPASKPAKPKAGQGSLLDEPTGPPTEAQYLAELETARQSRVKLIAGEVQDNPDLDDDAKGRVLDACEARLTELATKKSK